MLSLEPTDDLAKPAFKDAASCTKWLSQLQLTNLSLAQSTLRAQIDEFNRYPMRGKDRLQTLEALREPVAVIQSDYAKRLAGKKLPLTVEEYTSLVVLTNVWESMLNGYLRCLQSSEAGDRSLSSDAALLSQRSLYYCGLLLSQFLRMGYEPDGRSWQHFHTIYAHIEEQGLHLQAVADKFNHKGGAVSCRTLYVKLLLQHRARLLGLSRNQWFIVDRWLENWSETFSLEPRCTMTREDAPPLAVDLAGAHGFVPVYRATSAASMRYMAMVPLSKLMRVKIILLQQGQSPKQMELGDELGNKECLDLLNRLHHCWCGHRNESLADESRDAPVVQMVHGIENIYAHFARKPFKPPRSDSIAEKEAQRQIETFGRVLDATDRHNLVELGFVGEEWNAEEDTLLQASLLRRTTVGDRLGLNQIVCIFKPDAAGSKLGVITTVSVTRAGQLYVALRYLPGNPQAVIVRSTAHENLLSGAAAALLLPEISKLHIPASLILPRDWFGSGRKLEISLPNNRKQGVTLGISVEKGNDYERVGFTLET